MTFLSKLGRVMQIAGKVLGIAVGIMPGLALMTPTKKDDAIVATLLDPLTQIAGIVIQVEGMAQALDTPLPGTQKLQMATPIVAQIIVQSAILANREIANPALFKQGCAAIASGMADVLNSIKEDDAKTVTYSG